MPASGLIVDDHPIMRDALFTALLSLGVFESLDTASDFQELLDKLEKDASYQLLILDLSLTDISGSKGVVHIREHYPEIPILIFSGNDSTDIVAECFELGVHGFVSKNSSMEVFVHAIRLVLAGGIYIPPVAANLMGFEQLEVAEYAPQAGELAGEERVHFTPKQKEVFDQLMLGVPNKIIARRLDIAEGTVKAHLHSIYQLLGVSSRAQAILKSRQLQIIE
jgi:DNA-binding NarL/FixJ family response regulator